MRSGSISRIIALVAAIVLCLGLALAACAARRATTRGPNGTAHPTNTDPENGAPGTGGKPERAADAGVTRRGKAPLPINRREPSRGNKGMLGMGLEGGD